MSDYTTALARIVKDRDVLSLVCLPAERKEGEALITRLTAVALQLCSGPPGSLTCAGLAANQLGFQKRVIVVRLGGSFKGFVNPVILRRDGRRRDVRETCFSFPCQSRMVARSPEIILKADNILGTRKLRGFEAQAVQHEIDHLDGICI